MNFEVYEVQKTTPMADGTLKYDQEFNLRNTFPFTDGNTGFLRSGEAGDQNTFPSGICGVHITKGQEVNRRDSRFVWTFEKVEL